ncbi:MAG: LacI family DNA-binding transcriptional regulator [Geminicoccaceae bacterium]
MRQAGRRSSTVPTLEAVAVAAGVHRSTAARALNTATRHLISAEVVARVQAEAQRLGYRRDVLAASLRTGRSQLVGVVLPDLANPVFAPILGGIEAELARHGYSALVAHAPAEAGAQQELVDRLIGRRVDGLILATVRRCDPVLGHCLAAGVPTVLVNRAEDETRAPSVVSDDAGGMRLAVEHLVALGHVRIGHLAGPAEVSTGIMRRRGFEAAMRQAGLAPGQLATATAYSLAAGRAATAELLDGPPLTALVAANDLLALGAYQELAARGLACPRDLSIVGHNDMPLVDMVAPPLTTVRIDHLAMGGEAARLLLARIADGDAPPELRTTIPSLIVRASTAVPLG